MKRRYQHGTKAKIIYKMWIHSPSSWLASSGVSLYLPDRSLLESVITHKTVLGHCLMSTYYHLHSAHNNITVNDNAAFNEIWPRYSVFDPDWPFGQSGSYAGLIGFNPRRLKGPKSGTSSHTMDLSVYAKSSSSS